MTDHTFAALELPARADITLQLARGLELVRRHRWSHAVVALSNALDLDPQEPKALEHRARCYMMLGQMNAALEDAEKLVEVDKKRNAARAERIAKAAFERSQGIVSPARRINKNQQSSRSRSRSSSPTTTNQQQKENNDQNSPSSPNSKIFSSAAKNVLQMNKTIGVLSPLSPTSLSSSSGGKENFNNYNNNKEEEERHPFYNKSPHRFKNQPSNLTRAEFAARMSRNTATSAQRRRNFFKHATAQEQADLDEEFRGAGGATAGGTTSSSSTLNTTSSSARNNANEYLSSKLTANLLATSPTSSGINKDNSNININKKRRTLNTSSSPLRQAMVAVAASPQKHLNNQQQQQFSDSSSRANRSGILFSSPMSVGPHGSSGGGASVVALASSYQNNNQQHQQQQNSSPTTIRNLPASPPRHSAQHQLQSPPSPNSMATLQKNSSRGGGVVGVHNTNAPTIIKYYQGILLRANVLFAMGCFEEACRQFHQGQRIRPDVHEFSTGVSECEHILLGAVHPWRKRSAAPPASVTSAQRARRNTIVNYKDGKETKVFRPPKEKISTEDRELRLCMPEMADDYFFLKNLRQHPRIFETGIFGRGISRGGGVGDSVAMKQIGRQLDFARKSNKQQDPFRNISKVSSSFDAIAKEEELKNLMNKQVNSSSSQNQNNNSQNNSQNNNSFNSISNSTNFAGPAQLAAFCALAAVESAEEEQQLKQTAELLEHAERTSVSAAKGGARKSSSASSSPGGESSPTTVVPSGTSSEQANQSNTNTTQQQTTSSSARGSGTGTAAAVGHGMFGSLDNEDEEGSKKRRDFHVRPPDSRSWNLQSTRGRRRMKEGVDTTLHYLSTQKHFWAHRDERTTIPSKDEPDLPPRFRPETKNSDMMFLSMSNDIKAAAEFGASLNSARERNNTNIIDDNNNNIFSSSQNQNNMNIQQQQQQQHPRRPSSCKIPIRQVVCPNAETERLQKMYSSSSSSNNKMKKVSEKNISSRPPSSCSRDSCATSHYHHRPSSSSSTTFDDKNISNRRQSTSSFFSDDGSSEASGGGEGKQQHQQQHHEFPPSSIHGTSQTDEHDFAKDMHEVFKMMADQHNAKIEGAYTDTSELQIHRKNKLNYFRRQQRQQDTDAEKHIPKITSGEYQFIRNAADPVSSCVLAVPSNDAVRTAPPPVFVSDNLRNVHLQVQQALSKGTAEIVRDSVSSSSHAQQQQLSANQPPKFFEQQAAELAAEDLARIQLALFESGDESYHQGGGEEGGPDSEGIMRLGGGSGSGGVSPLRAVTLKWGEYDGKYIADAMMAIQQQKAAASASSKKSGENEDDGVDSNPLLKGSESIVTFDTSLSSTTHLGDASVVSAENEKNINGISEKEDAMTRKTRARQFARHQRARALIAQHIQKELGVELPYEAIFRVPLDDKIRKQQQQQDQEQQHQQETNTYNKNIKQDSPSAAVRGRDYATVSIKASPPQKAWQLKPGAVLEETRQQELEKALAISKKKKEEQDAKSKKQKEQQKKRNRRRRIQKARARARRREEGLEDDDDFDDEDEDEEYHDYDEFGNVVTKTRRKQQGRGNSPVRSEDDEEDFENDEDLNLDEEEMNEEEEEEEEQEEELNEYGEKKSTLTLDQIRSQYTKKTKLRLAKTLSNISGGSGGGGFRRKGLGQFGSQIGGLSSQYTSFRRGGVAGSDMDDTQTESDEDEEEDDETDDEDVIHDEEPQQQQQQQQSSSEQRHQQGRRKSEQAGIDEAISAAKALLQEHKKTSSSSSQQQQFFSTRDQSPAPGTSTSRGFVVTTTGGETGKDKQQMKQQQPHLHETAAMRKLNATLRNISRLCALGDVPQAISIAAALVKELESAAAAAGADITGAAAASASTKGHRNRHRPHPHPPSSPTTQQQESGMHPAFAALAAKLRCTLGSLYLEIGEGSAAVSELSRAVLLAKRVQQNEVYEQAVRLLGECYQTSDENVAEHFEGNRPGKRARATSIVRN